MRIIILILLSFIGLHVSSQDNTWKAQWITQVEQQNETNNWTAYQKTFQLENVPNEALAKIACDSKYWMWINGELAVFEGQVKRGPSPKDTYYDEVDIAPFLKRGENMISILVWYFGKDGFSHNSSGKAALIFDCQAQGFELLSDVSWQATIRREFGTAGLPLPNFRLPESSIRYDARLGNFDFTKSKMWGRTRSLGTPPTAPWNNLVKRPIPLWKDFGVKSYENEMAFPFVSSGDTIVCELPYNAQVTPYFKVEAKEGDEIIIFTDHYYGGGHPNVRGEYITRDRIQEYENLGWMNGQKVNYIIPEGIKVLDLKYRETGYNTEFTGSFNCNDDFYNRLWSKALRTLYVTMRDTYMDCPDRERAQWWGDAVNESGETFYALDTKSHGLTKKGILELINWQREDSTLFSPVPAGNWDKELPGQMLASIGYYGFWNYFMNTGDTASIEHVYDGVKRYIDIWELDENGVLVKRMNEADSKGWYWGDWGTNVDKDLLMNGWYYLALKGYKNMSELLGKSSQAAWAEKQMSSFKVAFNKTFWKGSEYRSYNYKDDTDDRGQALAVVAGLADGDKYNAIYKVLQSQEYSSPYMEKYVCEALFLMGQSEYGLERLKKRFQPMVDNTEYSTLFEGWGIGKEGFGGGSTNHAWSGGGLTILSQYVCGLYPIEAGWKSFMVKPELAGLKYAETANETIAGKVSVKITKIKHGLEMELSVPQGSEAVVYVPEKYKKVIINGKRVSTKEKDGEYALYRVK
ncbi:alpha-L-rhamnosidase C-terminal domain-containing protein [Carboxylicivirga sp. RSCT41]|uniref:alpha-L-rhamnosidase-related protein n=1 Tax=Carboxylicivirga agarovorans TaxID=3417570 RepID=UPI003D348046